MKAQQELERFRNDALYFDPHREELLAQYPDRWVAICDQPVVGAAKDLKRLIKQVQRKGLSPGRVYRGQLSTKEEFLILFTVR